MRFLNWCTCAVKSLWYKCLIVDNNNNTVYICIYIYIYIYKPQRQLNKNINGADWFSGNDRFVFGKCYFRTPSGTQAILSEFPLWFSTVFPGKFNSSISVRPRTPPSKPSPIHYSPVILSFDAIWSAILTAQ
jgi:hypothetical protein